MSATFARLFGADPTTLAAETVFAALPAFRARYHDWSDVEVAVHPHRADIVLHGHAGSLDVGALVAASSSASSSRPAPPPPRPPIVRVHRRPALPGPADLDRGRVSRRRPW